MDETYLLQWQAQYRCHPAVMEGDRLAGHLDRDHTFVIDVRRAGFWLQVGMFDERSAEAALDDNLSPGHGRLDVPPLYVCAVHNVTWLVARPWRVKYGRVRFQRLMG